MGYLGRRIGLSQDNGDSSPEGVNGAVGGGILDLFSNGYFERQGNLYNAPGLPAFGGPEGITATGGVISDYTSGPAVYRAHVFTSSGALNVTNTTSNFGATVEYLVVAGGGSGGSCWPSWGGGGGGAGGFRTNVSGHPLAAAAFPVSVNPYPVVVGAGGASTGNAIGKNPGNPSTFSTITSTGGGGGGGGNGFPSPGTEPGSAGGSGGGGAGGGSSENGGATTAVTTPSPWPGPSVQGFIGGGGADGAVAYTAGGGGGGAGGGGQSAHDLNSGPKAGGYGGVGSPIAIETATAKFYAGGGGGSSNENSTVGAAGGNGGGGKGGDKGGTLGTPTGAFAGTYATGGGGGAGIAPNISENGGSGIVVVRYQIGKITAALKASGGVVSFYGGKTIHAFTSSGTFIAPGSFNETVEYVIVAGGGGGATSDVGGAGGAGGYLTGTTPIDNTGPGNPTTTTVSVGAGAGAKTVDGPNGDQGTPSYFGTPLTAYGGGGGSGDNHGDPSTFGGSGGGARYGRNTDQWGLNPSTPAPVIATFPEYTPGTTQGYPGGKQTSGGPKYGSGGGGGAGGAGGAGTPAAAGVGGIGIRIPTTFHNPAVAPGPGTGPQVGGGLGSPGPAGGFYVAGGGGGSTEGGSFGLGGYGGGGSGGGPADSPRPVAQSGVINTGGGGGSDDNGAPTPGGGGGSGIVLIAYPT